MRRRRFRHSSKHRKSPSLAASGVSADWRDEFVRLKEIEAVLDQRMSDWSTGEQKYQANHLLPSYAMDRRYDIFMEPRVPEIAERFATGVQHQEQMLVLEDPDEILQQVESTGATDDLRARSGRRRPARKLLDPDAPRKRGFLRRLFGAR